MTNRRPCALLLLALALVPVSAACGPASFGEDQCALDQYKTLTRERTRTSGECGDFPQVAADAWDHNGVARCSGGYTTEVCTIEYNWECPGPDGGSIVSRGRVDWKADERTGHGQSSITLVDAQGDPLCHATYDETWTGKDLGTAGVLDGGAGGLDGSSN